ncbi:MAG: hypothetical protein WB795_20410 [Candidatus Acidiferrales bacterium]
MSKSRFGALLVVVTVSSALFAQNIGPGKPQDLASVLDAGQIARQSVAATERSWQARDHYTYTERDEDRRLDSLGQLKSKNADVTKMTLVNGVRFEQLIEHNGQPPSATEQRKSDEDLDKLKHETAAEQTARLRKSQENRALLLDVLEAFDFHVVGQEAVDGRPAYVLQATPHPGYLGHGKYGKIFNKVEGKLWIDKQDFGCIKIDGEVTQSFSIGLFVARVGRGSHIILEQMSVGDAVWMPKRVEVRASARILFLKSLDMDRILNYSDYLATTDSAYSVNR